MNTELGGKILIEKCILEIENKIKWGDSSKWNTNDFIELSHIIQNETQVLLSTTTLKRVWGKVSYSSSPSVSTLNALAQFIGYQNWRDFKNKQENDLKTTKKSLSKKVLIAFSLLGCFISLFTLFYFTSSYNKTNASIDEPSKIVFSSRPIKDGIPNSVVFDLDLTTVSSKDIQIQTYWDKTKTIQVDPQQKQVTGTYYIPGYFKAKLMIDGKSVKEQSLLIKSNGWIGTVDYSPSPKYIYQEDFFNGKLSLKPEIIDEIKLSEKPLFSTYHFIDDFGDTSADDFTLEATIKNSYNEKWAVSQITYICVLGTRGGIILPLASPGFSSTINLMFSDVFLIGSEEDLSYLSMDLSEYKTIKAEVSKNRLKIFIENKEVFSMKYHKPLGKLVGLRYKFLGAGEVKHSKIMNGQGDIVFIDNFSHK